MTTARPIRFGVAENQALPREELRALVRRAEALGYAVFLVEDHYDSEMSPITALHTRPTARTSPRFLLFSRNRRDVVRKVG